MLKLPPETGLNKRTRIAKSLQVTLLDCRAVAVAGGSSKDCSPQAPVVPPNHGPQSASRRGKVGGKFLSYILDTVEPFGGSVLFNWSVPTKSFTVEETVHRLSRGLETRFFHL